MTFTKLPTDLAITHANSTKLSTGSPALSPPLRYFSGNCLLGPKRKSYEPHLALGLSDQAAYSRRKNAKLSEIGPLPKVVDPNRKNACRFDLLLYAQAYYPESAGLGVFSADHIELFDDLQDVILHGGRRAQAVFRGFAKTTIGEIACIWATTYGHKKFLPLVGADQNASMLNIASIKTEIEGNDLLYEDFPEVCHPVRSLEGRPQRCGSQTLDGELTKIGWTADRLVFPVVKGSRASGACLFTTSIESFNRGLKHKLATGENVRPDFVFIDDPQTDASAASDSQVDKREAKINNTILKSAGHKKAMSVFVAGTIIRDGCLMSRLTDADKCPAWRGKTVPMVKRWPDANEKWLGQYAAIRRDFDREIRGDQDAAKVRATKFYLENREEMEAGAVVTWLACFSEEQHEVSAIQHAYNLLIDDGEEAFASECQNAPLKVRGDLEIVEASDLERKQSSYGPRVVPPEVEHLSAFVDVQGKALYWCVCGWTEGFTGYVLDYGTWPDQPGRNYRLASVQKTLAKRYGSTETGVVVREGLGELFDQMITGDWHRPDGTALRVGAAAIDMNWHESTSAVIDFCECASLSFPALPSSGLPVPAAKKPMAEWGRKKGQRYGDNWMLAKQSGSRLRRLSYDTNSWKTRVARSLTLPHGAKGSISLFKDKPSRHRDFALQVLAEGATKTEGNGRTVFQWNNPPGKDNHFGDCLVGCAVVASVLGVSSPGAVKRVSRKRRRVRYAN